MKIIREHKKERGNGMKKTIFIIFLLFASAFFTYSQGQLPQEIEEMEARLLELKAQVITLDAYSPKQFPDFEELEITNQLVELSEFYKRKFDLLIKQYNLFEEKIFPFLLKISEQNPQMRDQLITKLKEYSGQEKKSILNIQEEINRVALQIERLEKKIERIQAAAKDREIADEKKQKVETSSKTTDISTQIQRAEEGYKNYTAKIGEVEEKLKNLKADEKEQRGKIEEKNSEINAASEEAEKSKDIVKREINLLLAGVKEIRINGLEIPRRNSTKTFIYLTETAKKTLEEQAKNLKEEIRSLKKIRKKEVQDKAVKGVIIIIIAIFLVFTLNKIARRISRKIIAKVEKSEKVEAHQKQRYQTLSSVILSFVKILSWVMAVLWVLGTLDIDYAPFLVAAGGISLAIGFGAQSLVKDVVTGFFLLMEEQFALGDWVEIEGKSGTIEKISLRTVQFRSTDGTLNIVPNGSISSVSNSTHKWSRAVIKVGVSYDADSEQVLSILNEISRQIYNDPDWKDKFIEEPIAQGILSFGDSAVDFRVLAKTLPGEQWGLEREFHIRIKKGFDEKGIEIPYNFVNIIDRSKKETDS
jgi:small conductance mechanosensitive channel